MRTNIGHRVAVLSVTVFLLATSLQARGADSGANVEAEAVAGQPFGVGRVTVTFPVGRAANLRSGHGVWLFEKQGRALYPSFQTSTLPQPNQRTKVQSATAYFLFTGKDLLEVSIDIDDSHPVTVKPVDDPAAHPRLLADWWRWFGAAVSDAAQTDGYPQQADNYLQAMLARRLKLTPAKVGRRWSGYDDLDGLFGTLMGAESVRLAMQKDTILIGPGDGAEETNQPLPIAAAPPAVTLPNVPGEIDIEPLAKHVPAECFYVRCGRFADYQWLRQTLDEWGGDLRNLVAVRGIDYGLRERIERQLALRETVFSKLFGDRVIDDLAVVGTDTFFREGASFGMLFHAKNSTVLHVALSKLRNEAREATPNVSEETIKIDGHLVSKLSTPDNVVRSFHAVDGDFQLVTTSQSLVQRFFEAGRGVESLGGLPEFRWARHVMPLARNDAVFVYLSDPFFRLLVGPRYRAEMTRRFRSDAELELIELARLAARAEKRPADTIEQLVAGGFLPETFGRRSDGSRIVIAAADAAPTDSLRGQRGNFLPVFDVDVPKLTPSEVIAYKSFASAYARQWQRMDPVIVGLRRELTGAAADRREKVTFDVHLTPYAQQHYGWFAGFLAAPDMKQIAPLPGNVIEAEALVGQIAGRDHTTRVFVGLLDHEPDFSLHHGAVVLHNVENRAPFYIGEAQPTRLIDLLGAQGDSFDAEGYGHTDRGGFAQWRRKVEGFVLVSSHRRVLEEVGTKLHMEPAARPAQVRVRLNDLSQSQWSGLLNAYGYARSRETSDGNVQFFHTLMRQLHVEPDQCPDVTQRILGGRPVCTLGGAYVRREFGPGPVRWASTAWQSDDRFAESRIPRDFRFAFLDWLRRIEVEFSIDATTLTTHVELELQPKPKRP
jgi:hypothetical protein